MEVFSIQRSSGRSSRYEGPPDGLLCIEEVCKLYFGRSSVNSRPVEKLLCIENLYDASGRSSLNGILCIGRSSLFRRRFEVFSFCGGPPEGLLSVEGLQKFCLCRIPPEIFLCVEDL